MMKVNDLVVTRTKKKKRVCFCAVASNAFCVKAPLAIPPTSQMKNISPEETNKSSISIIVIMSIDKDQSRNQNVEEVNRKNDKEP